MGIGGPKLLLLATCLVLTIAIGLLIGGSVGGHWFASKTSSPTIAEWYTGLTKFCYKMITGYENCKTRKSILKFDDRDDINSVPLKGNEFDVILLLIILSIGLCFFALITAYTMFCSNGPKSWRGGAIITGVLSAVGVCLAFGGLGYSENRLADKSGLSITHGWTSIMTWAGAVIQLIGTILAFILIRVRPMPDFNKQGHVVYSNSNPATHYVTRDINMAETKPNYENQGYQGHEPGSREQYLGYNNYRNQNDSAQRQQEYERRQREKKRYQQHQQQAYQPRAEQQHAYQPRAEQFDRNPSYDNTGYHIR